MFDILATILLLVVFVGILVAVLMAMDWGFDKIYDPNPPNSRRLG